LKNNYLTNNQKQPNYEITSLTPTPS